ncbi:MAG TPA: nucleotide exchange factor GrpE [Candidatus Saccharimonadales bacterium]|nr:nucleotide exchange factor GrpE [Candidatus Saccharimonadales bacterium]
MAKKDDTQTDELRSQIDELTADLQRVHADFVNYRRRNDDERTQLMDVAKATAVTQLLPLIDNIERALGHMPADLANNQWAKGVAQLAKQCDTALKSLKVEPIEALGKPFDPKLHQAISYEEDGAGEEVVVEELQKGYHMGTNILRPSMVKVGRKEEAAPPEQVEHVLHEQKKGEPDDKEIPED